MKKVALIAIALCFTGSLFAQGEWPWQTRTTQVKVDDNTNRIKFIKFSPGEELTASEFPAFLGGEILTDDKDKFELWRVQEDQLGYKHIEFEQFHEGIKVDGSVWKVHTLNGVVKSMNGETHEMTHHPAQRIDAATAFQAALTATGATTYMWEVPGQETFLREFTSDPQATYLPTGELVYMQNDLGTAADAYRLTWKFDVYAAEPLSREFVYIDAETGEVIFRHTQLHSADRLGQAQTKYSGLNDITTDSIAGQYLLQQDNNGIPIATFDMANGTDYNQAKDLIDDDNFWDFNDYAHNIGALDAHWGAEQTYKYFFLEHGRSSFDDQGSPLVSFVNYDNSYFNAFWNGQVMTYGAGPGNNTPLTGIDVCGHEFAHGFTGNSSGLIYQNESGALNESFSDIFGTAIEFYGKPATANWLIGEDVGAFRSMSNPNDFFDPDTYLGSNWFTGTFDNGGVHINSGVQNYWFYLLVNGGSGTNDLGDAFNVSAIGMSDAAKIAYRNNNVYLTPNSGYRDARLYAIQSAIDLFGPCDNRVFQTMNAWQAVGVGSAYTGVLAASYAASDTLFCATPAVVDFVNLSSSAFTFEWNFGDGNTSTQVNPTHIYQNAGSYDVTLVAYDCQGNADTLYSAARIIIDFNQTCPINMPGGGDALLAQSCSGFLYDAGGSGDYPNNSLSTVTLESNQNNNVALTFSSFDYAPGDYIRIYDGPDIFAPLIGTFTGTNNPGTVTSTGTQLTVREFTNGVNQRAGFEATWSCLVSNDNAFNQALEVWPNPFRDELRIRQELSLTEDVDLRISDVYGKTLWEKSLSGTQLIDESVRLNNLASGVYFLRLQSGDHSETVKVQKQ